MNFQQKKLLTTNYSLPTKAGYSLPEMLIYVAILSVVSLLIINTVLSYTKGYKNLVVSRKIDHSALDIMERITLEIRSGTQVDAVNSVFDTNPGVLSLVSNVGGVQTVKKFYVDNGMIKLDVGGVYFGPLTLSNATITNLVFRKVDSSISNAIKIDMTVSSTSGGVTKTKTYHTTVILKTI